MASSSGYRRDMATLAPLSRNFSVELESAVAVQQIHPRQAAVELCPHPPQPLENGACESLQRGSGARRRMIPVAMDLQFSSQIVPASAISATAANAAADLPSVDRSA